MFPIWSHWDGRYTTKGLVKLTVGRILKLVAGLSAILALVYRVKKGKESTRQAVVGLVMQVRQLLRRQLEQVASRV